jgi:hypothetical protein
VHARDAQARDTVRRQDGDAWQKVLWEKKRHARNRTLAWSDQVRHDMRTRHSDKTREGDAGCRGGWDTPGAPCIAGARAPHREWSRLRPPCVRRGTFPLHRQKLTAGTPRKVTLTAEPSRGQCVGDLRGGRGVARAFRHSSGRRSRAGDSRCALVLKGRMGAGAPVRHLVCELLEVPDWPIPRHSKRKLGDRNVVGFSNRKIAARMGKQSEKGMGKLEYREALRHVFHFFA